MKQILIVEGNDAAVLFKLCEIHKMPLPTGYSKENILKFIKSAGGFDRAIAALRDTLDSSDLTNIGLVVDANDKGPDSRWIKIKNILSDYFSEETLKPLVPKPGGIIVQERGFPITFGVWIMPDNQNSGYLEHFVADMIPDDDEVWGFAQTTVRSLEQQEFCRFKAAKRQKVLVHTWLAWQEEPGKPFGIALESKYLDASANVVEPFLEWMKSTFQLG